MIDTVTLPKYKKKKSVFDFKSVDFGEGSEKSSQEIDEVLAKKDS